MNESALELRSSLYTVARIKELRFDRMTRVLGSRSVRT